jgi:hypothetical protein
LCFGLEVPQSAAKELRGNASREQEIETRWKAVVDREMVEVREQGRRIEKKSRQDLEQIRNRMAEHEKERPREPKGLGAMFGGQARYEKAQQAWEKENAGLQNRHAQVVKRIGIGRDHAEQSNSSWYQTKGERLAEKRAERKQPELGREVRSQQRERAVEQARRSIEEKQQRERGMDSERER